MSDGSILFVSAPLTDRQQLDVRPAPVLELTYAYYYLIRRLDKDGDSNLPWVRQLREDPPAWIGELRTLWRRHQVEWLGYELIMLACALGYASDAAPDRFLSDFPQLPAKLLEIADELGKEGKDEKTPEDAEKQAKAEKELMRSYELLSQPEAGAQMQSALRSLWAFLEPAWEREGRLVSEAASAQLEHDLATSGDLLAALPPHHFVQFEESAAEIREHLRLGRITVAPLFFASQGGFRLHVRGTMYLGYGVNTETHHQQQQRELSELANRLKAFSDPTRLQMMALISKLRQFPLTVGDLARHVGVTQPTASGHLKLLREAGLVNVVREGNRSLHRLDVDAVRMLLAQLEGFLVN